MIVIDFETRSLCDLKEAGAHVYAAHPSTEIICLCYKIDDAPVGVWRPGDAPLDLGDHAVWAWNVAFERAIWERFFGSIPADRWNDIMAVAAYKAMPLGLDDCAKVLRLINQKSETGLALINKYCKPISKKNQTLRVLSEDVREEFVEYCKPDVEAEFEALKALGNLTHAERKWWLLEQEINNRGITVDIPSVEKFITVAEAEALRVNDELNGLTDGVITSANQAARFVEWVSERQPDLIEDCQKENMGPAIAAAQSYEVRRVLELRVMGSKASTKKLYRMQQGVTNDCRARGLMQYHGATTGREAGRRIQPQNLFRPDEAWLDLGLGPDDFADLSPADAADFMRAIYEPGPTAAIASMLRNLLVAAPGKTLVAGDFSAVEGRVVAAIAGEEKKLEAFRAVDRGEADDIYCVTASGIYGYLVRKKTHKLERQVGKIAELASGFQGSVGAWKRFGADRLGWDDDAIIEKVYAWRGQHPQIVALWKGLELAGTSAVARPGEVFSYRAISYAVSGKWLRCRLPSGRCIHYYNPQLATGKFGNPTFSFEANKQLVGGGRAWRTISAYGGLLTENVVQAVARDLMVEAAFRAEAAGWPIVLTVHDELVCEVSIDKADPAVLERLMSITPIWAEGWPITAEAWAGRRYRK